MKNSLLTAGMAAAVPRSAWSKVMGANDDVRLGIIGIHGQGSNHINYFRKIPGVRVVALCDVDEAVLNREVQKFKYRKENVKAYEDVRKLLEDKEIDAITTASPNHWHALITVWACQAGKDVYVEKPVCHEIWEGRKMVEAARKYNRIVQAGTQSRSDKGLIEALAWIKEGNLGKIIVARGFCYKPRPSIGKVDGPQPIPRTVNYDLWTGPAPLEPLRRKSLHYDWHWVWPTGNGDIGNQGVHQMDICRWALGQGGLPRRVMSIGGRFGYDDDGTTANTQVAILDYEPAPLIFEVRGLPQRKGGSRLPDYHGIRIGVVIQCEGGYFAGGWAYDNQGNKIKQFARDGGGDHHPNFIKAVRSRKVSDLNADILQGYISSSLCHMANISYRLGRKASPEEIEQAFSGNEQGLETFRRFKDHLFANWIDLSKTRATLGPWLEMDPIREQFVDAQTDSDKQLVLFANDMLRRRYREPFVVPERV